MVGTTHLFCPTIRFSLPHPNFRCHILYSIFIYCLPSTYTIVESSAICHFLQQFLGAFMAESRFSSLSNCLLQPFSLTAVLTVIPSIWGPLSSLTYPSWCFMDLCLPLFFFFFFVLFFSLDFKIPSTAKVLPPFSACKVLHTLANSAEV